MVTTHAAEVGRLLVVDDDVELTRRLVLFLEERSFAATAVHDGRAALSFLDKTGIDLVLLDLGLPGLDGFEVLRAVRTQGSLPVIVITSNDDERDTVFALELGADDYVTKPIRSRELLARVRSVLRRSQAPRTAGIAADKLKVDLERRTAHLDGHPLELSGIEFDFLAALVRQPGQVLTRDALLRRAGRGEVHLNERTVDVHICRLRRKLTGNTTTPGLIKTVHGRGYVFVPSGSTGGDADGDIQ